MKKPILLLALTTLIISCNTTEPPNGEKPTLTLKLEDASCTEAWITLTTTNLQLPAAIHLKRDNTVTQDINLSSADTLLYIDSLLPNTNYQYQASSIQNPATSNTLNVTTMDTTSHNFNWQTFTFGEAGGSALYDIAIIDENNIWAVGEIYMLDSLGNPDPQPYGIAIWDGQSWELKKLFYNTNIPVTPKGIFVINPTEIYLASGSIFKWDGSFSTVQLVYSRLSLPDPNATIEKLWGRSGSSIYGVGNAGSIVFYNGSQWRRIESGTETIIKDIWGITGDSNELILYCPVSSFFVPGEKKILKITDNVVDSVSWNFDRRIYSVWTPREGFLYVCGEGVFENKFNVWRELNTPLVGTNSVRGNNINDIIIAGDNGFITHFNGVSWKTLSTYSNKGYAEVSFKDEIVAICGNYQGQGLIEIGKRN
jgi:hypothetical protein